MGPAADPPRAKTFSTSRPRERPSPLSISRRVSRFITARPRATRETDWPAILRLYDAMLTIHRLAGVPAQSGNRGCRNRGSARRHQRARGDERRTRPCATITCSMRPSASSTGGPAISIWPGSTSKPPEHKTRSPHDRAIIDRPVVEVYVILELTFLLVIVSKKISISSCRDRRRRIVAEMEVFQDLRFDQLSTSRMQDFVTLWTFW